MALESHYVVIKLANHKGLSVGLLKWEESGATQITLPSGQKATASRAHDFIVPIPIHRIDWIDGSADARAGAKSAGLPILPARESQWLAYGQAFVKDRGAHGGRKTKGQITDAKLKAVRKNWGKVWPKHADRE